MPSVQAQLFTDARGYVRNRGLFAEHFLRERLPELPGWQDQDAAQDVFLRLKALYDGWSGKDHLPTNESQTEDGFIRPALEILWGPDSREVQVTLPGAGERGQPDYALFVQPTGRAEAEPHKGSAEYWQHVDVLADAKRWHASLDRREERHGSPSAQIGYYLYRANVPWGILTNGRVWRLYEREKSRAGGVFFEVDLAAILENDARASFQYFHAFFRREAFVAEEPARSFVGSVLTGSRDYAAAVGEDLKESVYEALRLLINGFLDHHRNKLDRADPATLQKVHEISLLLLYRLLFLLYAEDRKLLPREDEAYESFSLHKLQAEMRSRLKDRRPPLKTTYRFWDMLLQLFEMIDDGHDRRAGDRRR